MSIFEDPTVTVKCRAVIQVLFLYFNLCLNYCVKLDSSSCSVLTNYMFFGLIAESAVTVDGEDDLLVTTYSTHDKVSYLGNWLFYTKMLTKYI